MVATGRDHALERTLRRARRRRDVNGNQKLTRCRPWVRVFVGTLLVEGRVDMGRPGRKRRLVLVDEYWAFSRPVSALVRPADWQDRMVPTDQSPQLCATDSCGRPAVFRSRAKPTWCPDCLEGVYR